MQNTFRSEWDAAAILQSMPREGLQEIALDAAASPLMRCGALIALARTPAYDPSGVFLALLDQSESALSYQVLNYCRRWPSDGVLNRMCEIALSPAYSARMRFHAVTALAELRHPAAVAICGRLLEESDTSVQMAAVTSMGIIGDCTCRAPLERVWHSSSFNDADRLRLALALTLAGSDVAGDYLAQAVHRSHHQNELAEVAVGLVKLGNPVGVDVLEMLAATNCDGLMTLIAAASARYLHIDLDVRGDWLRQLTDWLHLSDRQ